MIHGSYSPPDSKIAARISSTYRALETFVVSKAPIQPESINTTSALGIIRRGKFIDVTQTIATSTAPLKALKIIIESLKKRESNSGHEAGVLLDHGIALELLSKRNLCAEEEAECHQLIIDIELFLLKHQDYQYNCVALLGTEQFRPSLLQAARDSLATETKRTAESLGDSRESFRSSQIRF